MMNASDPPSSSTVFFSAAPAVAATDRPARSLPVSVTARTTGWRITSAAASWSIIRFVNTPGGKPAWRKTSSIARAQPGTFGACFSTPTLPAIRVGAANRNTCQSGKFHGMIAKTAPSGS